MDKWQALNDFWNGFNLSAYDEATVPDDAKLPYITYTAGVDEFGSSISLTASLWYRSKTWSEITAKLEEIADSISSGGIMIKYNTGVIWLKKGRPFAQRVKDPDDSIRRIYMNIEAEFIN